MKKFIFLCVFLQSVLYADSSLTLGEQIKGSLEIYPDFPRKGILFRDISPILRNPEHFEMIIDHFCERYKDKGIDSVVILESRGFLFGTSLAYRLHLPMVMIRKKGKLPGDVFNVSYKKLYGEDSLEMQKIALKPGQKVIIIDDFFSTGGTLEAAATLVEQSGAVVYEAAFLFNNPVKDKRKFHFPIYCITDL